MRKNGAETSDVSLLAGPAVITINVASPRGPIASKAASLSVPQTHICLVNTSTSSVMITRLTIDPLQRSETGATAESNLTVEAAQPELAPGESATVTISGLVPAAPAVYTSTLRVTLLEGSPLSIHVEFNVAARAAWGFACMVFGLSLVGIINALDGESGIQGELHRALLARQALHEFLQQTPPPQSRVALVENVNREFDAAIESLQKPRKLSFVDHRGTDAQEHLKTATELTADLHKALSEKPRGSIEVDDLAQEWKNLKDQFAALSELFLIPTPQGSSLAQHLGAFDAWAAQRLMRPPIDYYTIDSAYHVSHVHLLQAAGREQDAANEAIAVRRWMQRAADFVNAQARLLKVFEQLSANNLATVDRIRQRLEAAGIIPERRIAILKSLDETASLLSGSLNWPVRRTVAQRINDASINTLLAEKDTVLIAAESARAQEEKEDSLDSIQAVIDEGATLKRGADGKIDLKEKMAWLRRCAAAWRTRLATFPDPNPPAMRAELDALEAAIESNDLDAISVHSRGLFEQWRAYSIARAQSLIRKAVAPFCLRIREDTLVDLEATQQTMRRLEGNPNLLKWEGELDRLRVKTYAMPNLAEQMPPDCRDVMSGLATNAYQLSNEVSSAMWSAAALPEATKHELAADLGTILTTETLRDLISDVRPLRIDVTTPQDERYVGRQIEFKIANLDPVWGPGVIVVVDFGDGQHRIMTAEDLRKNKSVMHVYADAKSFTLAVVAADAFKPDTMQPVHKALGEGEMRQFSISPSPISAARQISDIFFNARFGLALLIAGLLYFWRYQARKAVFGANAFDYAEAFTLGFAVSLAIDSLPQKLAEFIK